MRRRHILTLLPALAPNLGLAQQAKPYIDAQAGTLPLILTVPHDGAEFIGQLPLRTQGVVVRDLGTRVLAERTADALQARTGQRPHLVVARFSRKVLDANRPVAEAMQSDDALPAYQAYHGQIAAFVADLKARFPQGALLLDVHGQAGGPDTTYRGTRAGLTTKALVARHGLASIQGEKSIISALTDKGYAVRPAVGAESPREDPRYNGGHTVFHYGSHQRDGIDAIQLEFGSHHRANPQLPDDLADALVTFMTTYGLMAP
jgi:N-formylglutamate amidohydrolase